MNNQHKNLLQSMTPRPLPNKVEYDKQQKEIDPSKNRYFVKDQYGVERPLPPNFQPQTDDQIRYIVRARNITIIKKTATETKEFTPHAHVPLQAMIINSFEILHDQHDWITIDLIQQHLATLQINRTTDEILNELRTIYKKAQSNANDVIFKYRKNMEGDAEFQIKTD